MEQFDPSAFRRYRNRSAQTVEHNSLIEKVALERLLEKCDYIQLEPERILCIGITHPELEATVSRYYPNAHLLFSDVAEQRLTPYKGRAICQPFEDCSLQHHSIDAIIVHQTLHWLPDPLPFFKEVHRVLKPGGLFLFSALGPETLMELRHAMSTVDDAPHVHIFYDLHDLGDMMHEVGFEDPVMDAEKLTITYKNVHRLCKDLSLSGQSCHHPHRRKTLTGKARWQKMMDAYERFKSDDQYPATYELSYGQAFKPTQSLAKQNKDNNTVSIHPYDIPIRRKTT